MTTRRPAPSSSLLSNNGELSPIMRRHLDGEASKVLTAEEETALAKTIASSRAALWTALGSLADALGSKGANLTLVVADGRADTDDEHVTRAMGLARAACILPMPEARRARTAIALDAATTAARSLTRAKDTLVRRNMRLVVMEAHKQFAAVKGLMPLADLVQEGSLGAMKAAARFDHTRDLRFSTFALWWIRHAIGRAIADKSRTIRVPVYVSTARRPILRAIEALARSGNTDPTDLDIARQVAAAKLAADGKVATDDAIAAVMRKEGAISANVVATVRETKFYTLSANAPINSDDGAGTHVEIIDRVADDRLNLDSALATASVRAVVSSALGTLPARAATIVRRRLAEENLQAIADDVGLSRERIRQIETKGVGLIRRALLIRGITCVAHAGVE